jgi:outer membrane protein assembly factor BamB
LASVTLNGVFYLKKGWLSKLQAQCILTQTVMGIILKSIRVGALFFIMSLVALAEDWPAYRGPSGNGTSNERISWPEGGPKKLWTTSTHNGFSSFTESHGKVFTIVTKDIDGAPFAVLLALEANTGKELWASKTGIAKFPGGGDAGAEDNKGGDGPRSSPTLSGNKAYVYSADLVVQCFDTQDGKLLWSHDVLKEFNGKNISWKSAMSPVIDGDLLFVAGGGQGQSILAFNKDSGEIAWKTADDAITHATPVVATIHGVRQLLFLMQSGLVALEPKTGKELWRFAFPYRTATGCSPVVGGDIVFCTAGYGIGGAACQVTKTSNGFEVKELWRIKGDNAVASLWSTPVCKDGYLYGMISYKKFSDGPLKCIELKTGKVNWEQPGFGAGNVILAGDDLIALSDKGEVVLLQANPEGYKEKGRVNAISGKCWSTPALSRGKLFVRSTKEGACLEFGGLQTASSAFAR